MGYHPDDYDNTPSHHDYSLKKSDAESTKTFIEMDHSSLNEIEEQLEELKGIDNPNPRAQFEIDCLEAILEAEQGDE